MFLGKVRKEEEEEELFKKEELLLEEGAGKEGCLFRGTVFTCDCSVLHDDALALSYLLLSGNYHVDQQTKRS